jgi:hypothetical protein
MLRNLIEGVWEWLRGSARRRTAARDYDLLMANLNHVRAGRKFNRDEMNAR